MISIIAAYSKNRVIGYKGKIPWKIKGEQLWFKELTLNHVVIMGRRTYESIGKPLDNRLNIVVTSTLFFDEENLKSVKSLKEALSLIKDKEAFIIGGQRLYEEALPIVDVMYITEIDLEVKGDTYFPSFDENKYQKTIIKEVNDQISYRYIKYQKIDND